MHRERGQLNVIWLSWSWLTTGSPSSSCEMIILRITVVAKLWVCLGIFTTALKNNKIRQILGKIPHLTSTFRCLLFDCLLRWKEPILAIYLFWGFSTYIRKVQGCTLHFRSLDPRWMCLDSALDLWPLSHFELGFFASRIERSEMECAALGFLKWHEIYSFISLVCWGM